MFHPKGPTFFELARQALSSTEKGYDLLAPKFDYTPFRTPDLVLKPVFDLIEQVDAALDLCCGTGAAMNYLKPICRKRLAGFDASAGMMREAKRLLTPIPGAVEPEFIQGDAYSLPFSREFDLIVCFGALGHIPRSKQKPFVEGVARALKPGGRFIFVTGNHPPFFSLSHLLARCFNGAMHLRNLLWKDRFIMFYLTFLLPECVSLLEEAGFSVEVKEGVFQNQLSPLKPVIATLKQEKEASVRRRVTSPSSS